MNFKACKKVVASLAVVVIHYGIWFEQISYVWGTFLFLDDNATLHGKLLYTVF